MAPFLVARGRATCTSLATYQGDVHIGHRLSDVLEGTKISYGCLSHPVYERNRMHLICIPESRSIHTIDKESEIPLQSHNKREYIKNFIT